MAEEVVSLEALSAHFHRLQDPEATAADRTESDQWLQRARVSASVWTAAFEALSSTGMETPFALFAAQTLRYKVLTAAHQLESVDERLDVRARLVGLVVDAAASVPGSSVETQLVLALVALALHMGPAEWPDVISDAVTIFTEQVPDKAVGTHALVVFLRLFPEEVANTSLLLDPALQAEAEDTSLAPDSAAAVVSLLGSVLSSAPSEAAAGAVLDAIAQWVRYMTGEALAESGVVEAMFDSLAGVSARGPMLEGLAAVLLSIIEVSEVLMSHQLADQYDSLAPEEYDEMLESQAEYVDVVGAVFPRIVALTSSFDASAPIADVLLRLIVETGISYQSYIQVLNSDETMAYASFMVELLTVDDEDVTSSVLHFWRIFIDSLGGAIAHDSINVTEQLGERYNDLFRTLLSYVVIRNALHLASHRLEPQLAAAGRNAEISSSSEAIVAAIADVASAGVVLGWLTELWAEHANADSSAAAAPTAGQPWQLLYSPGAASLEPRLLRSLLACLAALGPSVYPSETTLVGALFFSLDAECLAASAEIIEAMLAVVAAFPHWLKAHPQAIEAVLNYLLAALETSNAGVNQAAAAALNSLCMRAQEVMRPSFDALLTLFTRLVSQPLAASGTLGDLDDYTAGTITFALAAVAAIMEPRPALAALDALLSPLIAPLAAITDMVESGEAGAVDAARTGINLIHRLALGIHRSRGQATNFAASGLATPAATILERTGGVLHRLAAAAFAARSAAGLDLLAASLRLLQVLMKASPLAAFDLVRATVEVLNEPLGEVYEFLNVVFDVYAPVVDLASPQRALMDEHAGGELADDDARAIAVFVAGAFFGASSQLLALCAPDPFALSPAWDGDRLVGHGTSIMVYCDIFMLFFVNLLTYFDSDDGAALVRAVTSLALELVVTDWPSLATQGLAVIETLFQYTAGPEAESYLESMPSEAFYHQLLVPLAGEIGPAAVAAALHCVFFVTGGAARVEDLIEQMYYSQRDQFQAWLHAALANVDDLLLTTDDKRRIMTSLFDAHLPSRPVSKIFSDLGALVAARSASAPR
ncbi:uncharacterized protein AMSG_00377 [Thecamonas trahens ATCC 50062]|uniref:Exportin-1/Importin-beta-like domain-containing protein n=1 Tax=Thecamonas trahens ATCC 50062 TaxID=461836 RepID=A0A0L0D8Q8_THETB|nr:hypothetical protein AMSG_00377 [Thecamonas trahens ATCC 50062]KNC48600.1 hypothetical protein AMSG_00377 [Thecamonas trahens ATCC 50062]|eukprot:XP_013762656.1 hypothetical protein AMSG_00377 [Thecamonas trahens ATCC 50062]